MRDLQPEGLRRLDCWGKRRYLSGLKRSRLRSRSTLREGSNLWPVVGGPREIRSQVPFSTVPPPVARHTVETRSDSFNLKLIWIFHSAQTRTSDETPCIHSRACAFNNNLL